MYCLTEIIAEDLGDAKEMAVERFKLVSRCTDASDRGSAGVLQAVGALKANDQKVAVKGLRKFLNLAQLGVTFDQLADGAIHQAFDSFYCPVSKKQETVWRYRHGEIRILFFYSKGKVVLLADVVAKRTDNLKTADKARAMQEVSDFLDALQRPDEVQWI